MPLEWSEVDEEIKAERGQWGRADDRPTPPRPEGWWVRQSIISIDGLLDGIVCFSEKETRKTNSTFTASFSIIIIHVVYLLSLFGSCPVVDLGTT